MPDDYLLAVKIGNSNLGFGLFQGAQLSHTWRAETLPDRTADEYASLLSDLLDGTGISLAAISGVGIVSVVPSLTHTFRDVCRRYLGCEPFVAAPGVRTGLELRYDDPRALGADRLVDLIGARARYGSPLLVVDLGTATTFNALDAKGVFVGGAIAPGLQMSAQALHQFTASLPRIDIAEPPAALATNTLDALRAGLLYGYAGMIEGLVHRIRHELGDPPPFTVATGGLAELVSRYCPSIQRVDKHLALEGLRLLYELNQQK